MKKHIFMKKHILFLSLTLSLTTFFIHCSTSKVVKADEYENINENSKRTERLKNKTKSHIGPDWITKVPTSDKSYFFVGLGEDIKKDSAKAKATQDALGQIALLIHTSINSQNSFSSVYKENELSNNNKNTDSFSLTKKGFSKLKVKGQGSINDFAIKGNYTRVEQGITSWYVLAEIPKSSIEKARDKIKKLRQKLKKLPAIVVGQNIISNVVKDNLKLKSFFESFYQSQGYYILGDMIEGEEGLTNIKNRARRLGAKLLIYAAISVDRIFKDFTLYIANGTLLTKEIVLDESAGFAAFIINNKNNLYFDVEKGIGRSKSKAFYNLETKLLNKLWQEYRVQNTKQDNDNGYFAH